jgi:hypothetical protein
MKTNLLIKAILTLSIFLFSNFIFAQDNDNDGVLDSQETIDGTDPNDPCDYLISSITSANTAGLDCDNDGVLDVTEIANGTDPHDPCDYLIYSMTLPNTAGLDCDNDGVDDATELASGTDPHDPCDYMVADQASPNTNTAGQDCDGDGVLDTTELTNGTDSFDACDYNVVDVTVANTAGMDCDGDGVLDLTELTNGTDPHNACDYNIADVTVANTAGMDCDGDGVLDLTELANGTNPDDPCDYVLASVTLTPTTLCNGNTITGNIKFDYNTNGCDAADFPLSNVMVKSVDGSNTFTTFTNISGDYTQYTNAGNFSTSASGFSSSYAATPNAQTTTFVGVGNTDNIDFCVVPASTVNDLNITVIPMNNPVPSNTVSYQIVYKNVGNTIVNGSVNFTYDNTKIVYQSSSIATSATTSNSVSYNYSTLNPYEIRTITVTFLVNAAAIGDILVFNSQVDPVSGDATPYDNTITFAQIVSSVLANRSPNNTSSNNNVNDVLVLEGNQVELQHADEYLHYVIRYQNTSASQITDLIVTTELSDKLDWNTMQLQIQSHNGQVYILNGNQITFKFANINLAAGAQGYIAYRVKPISSIVVGDVIPNQSKMYFDVSPVITTSTITTTITSTAGVNDNNLLNDVNVYPNPSKGLININAANDKITHADVYNYLGQLVVSFKDLDINTINLTSLSKGIYFLKLKNKKGSAIKKIVLE